MKFKLVRNQKNIALSVWYVSRDSAQSTEVWTKWDQIQTTVIMLLLYMYFHCNNAMNKIIVIEFVKM